MREIYLDNSATTKVHKEAAEMAYKVGRSTLIELNDAQLALTQAQLAESQAIYNFVTAKASLEQTLGHDFID